MTEGVFIGIGSNQGASQSICKKALIEINVHPQCQVTKVSSWYFTEPMGPPNQPNYVNSAAYIETNLSPYKFLDLCLCIEQFHHRERTMRWGPRTLDIDILLWPGKIIRSHRLRIPHPELQNRRFVLKPLSDIEPHLKHPLLGKTIDELLELLPEHFKVEFLENS